MEGCEWDWVEELTGSREAILIEFSQLTSSAHRVDVLVLEV